MLVLRRAFSRFPVACLVVGCLALAALSLLGPHQATYDPWAWLVWGREIADGTLNTVGAPSWKPFPVVFTIPFSLAGAAAPQLWLVVARAGFLLGLVAAWRLASSVAGRAAGALAVVGILLVARFVALSARGDSEGLLVALSLGGIALDREGRRWAALAAGLAACLVRPEAWPFVGAYALWIVWRHVDSAHRARVVAALGVAALVVLAAWFVPERLGSGSLLRGASRAREPVAGSPAQSAVPFLAVFGNSAGAVPIALYVGGVWAVLMAWRDRRGARRGTELVLGLAAAATVYMLIVGILAQAGFTGNERYVLLPASVVCVLGAIGLVWAVQALPRRTAARWATAAAAAAGLALCGVPALDVWRQLGDTQTESRRYDQLGPAIDGVGGPAAFSRCGPIYSDAFQTQAVLWSLHLTGPAVGIHPSPPGTIIAPANSTQAADARFPLRERSGGWVVRSTCPLR